MEEKFEHIKGVIKSCQSKKNRQHNSLKKNYERTKNDLKKYHTEN